MKLAEYIKKDKRQLRHLSSSIDYDGLSFENVNLVSPPLIINSDW